MSEEYSFVEEVTTTVRYLRVRHQPGADDTDILVAAYESENTEPRPVEKTTSSRIVVGPDTEGKGLPEELELRMWRLTNRRHPSIGEL